MDKIRKIVGICTAIIYFEMTSTKVSSFTISLSVSHCTTLHVICSGSICFAVFLLRPCIAVHFLHCCQEEKHLHSKLRRKNAHKTEMGNFPFQFPAALSKMVLFECTISFRFVVLIDKINYIYYIDIKKFL